MATPPHGTAASIATLLTTATHPSTLGGSRASSRYSAARAARGRQIAMEFHPRVHPFSGNELAELVAISPDDGAMQQGFRLQDPEVDDVIRTAKELEGGCVEPDTSLSAEENVELLLRATRLLQLGLEVQYAEGNTLLAENNELRGNLRELEETNRGLEAEVGELRELRDQQALSGDVRELELELKELRHALDEERRANDQLIQQSDRDRQTIDALEGRLQHGDDALKLKDDELADSREQLSRLRDDFDELRGQYAALTQGGAGKEQQREMSETIRQQEWKIERLTKDNRALEASNCELRAQLDAVKEENLQVSEKIVLLDAESKELRLAAAAADDRAEVLGREKAQVVGLAEELRADVAAKMALLDEFEARFARQYRSWDEERGSLQSQIEALRKEARLYVSSNNKGRGGSGTGAGGSEGDGQDGGSGGGGSGSAAKVAALDQAKENEVLLLEAYEQLEADVGQEVDRALARQGEELGRLGRRVAFLEGRLETEQKAAAALGKEGARLEGELADAAARNAQYESGVYGLPQAALEIRQLKETVAGGEARVRELVQQVNKLSAALEDLSDEGVLLRRKAGLPPDAALDTAGGRLQRDVTIAQLRSVNALLERQVSDLEEERRKLRLEVKFRAKYHGKAALEMGLSPEQLLLLEEYVEGLKGGRHPEERLVTTLQQRIEFLEVRLAEVMAYADIPINMRPALTELSSAHTVHGSGSRHHAAAASAAASLQHLAAGLAACGDGGAACGEAAGPGVAGGIKATQVELIRGALLGCLKMLRQMSEALAEHRQISDTEYKQFADTVIDKLVDAERVATLILRDLSTGSAAAAAQASAAAAAAAVERAAAEQQQRRYGSGGLGLDDNFVADAAADELRGRLQQLAQQVVELQVSLAQKDALLQQLAQHKAAMEARLGLTGGAQGNAAAVAAAAIAARRGGDYVSREQHEAVALELCSVKEQLIECLEELSSRERELSEMGAACRRYQSDMAELSDATKLLYRDYAAQAASWQAKCADADKQLKKARANAADATSQASALDAALKTLEAGDADAISSRYVDAVRKMAVVQLKHAKVARQLEAAATAERAASERCEELQEELQDVSTTCRNRMHWLEQAASDAARRTQQLYSCLQNTAPLEAYHALVAKHSQLAQEHRRALEEMGDAALSSEAEELLAVRTQLAELLPRYDAACDAAAELREKVRQLELPTHLSSTAKATLTAPSARPGGYGSSALASQALLASAAGSSAGGSAQPAAAVGSAEVQMQLNQDLVGAMVKLDSAARRLEVLEREKARLNQSLLDSQALTADLEQRLAQASAELSTSRALESRLQQRLAASVPAAQLQDMATRLEEAEAAAAQEGSRITALTLRAEDAERRLAELGGKRQRQLADITNLKTAVRELSSTSDSAAQAGKLVAELDHVRAKEGLTRSALNRSELERLELERQARGLKQQVGRLTLQLAIAQDQGRWAESELLDTLTRLQVGLSGRVESWKAAQWAAKLEQLRARNDGLATALEAAVQRFSKLEDAGHEAQLLTELREDMVVLLSKSASEAHREVAALKEQHMGLKLEAGKLTRAELLMRHKVQYLEAVNAELCEQVERCDATAMSQQGGLAAEKAELAARMRQLQEEVICLQDRSSGYLTELDELKAARSSRSLLALPPPAGAGSASQAGGSSTQASARSAAADKELMLRQIDSLKEARTEAEHMRQEVRRLEGGLDRKTAQLAELQAAYDDVLERLRGQSSELLSALGGGGAADETALSQLRAIAEAAMLELQAKVREREAQLAALASKGAAHQAAYMEQHSRDRAEIEALNNKLFESGAASIAGLKANLARASAVLTATGDGGEELPYEQLRLLLDERSSELEVLRNRLQQREASSEAQRRTHEAQAQRQQAEIQRLAEALEAAAPRSDQGRPGGGSNKMTLQRLAAEVKSKDAKLAQLRGAIKALEGKLAQLLKDKVDIVLQASSWVEQEQLDERLAEVEGQKAQLAADLHATHAELSACRKSLASHEGLMRRMSEQLVKEGEAVLALKAQLGSEQALVRAVREQLASKAPAGGSSQQQQQQQQVEALQQRIDSLEQEKQQLASEVSRLAAYSAALQSKAEAREVGKQGTAAAASMAGHGVVQPLAAAAARLGSTGSVALPDTPTASSSGATAAAGKAGGRGASARSKFSSEGGAATPSAAAPEARGGSRLGSGRVAAAGVQEGDGAGAVGGVSYAPEQWEQAKQLQAKVDSLRKKLAGKREECEGLLRECERRSTIVAGLTADKGRLAAALAAAQSRLLKLASDQEGAPAGGAAGASSSGSSRAAAAGGSRRLRHSSASGDPAQGSRAASQEAELLATVVNLKAALEQATTRSTPTARHMQEVQQRKAAQHEASRLRAELDKLQPQPAASSGRVAELQAANAALRVAATELKQRLLLAADPMLADGDGSTRAAGELEAAELQLQLAQRASEAATLRAELAALQQENGGLREELAAADPAFFEEVEDLKHAHQELQQTAAAQARLIRQLQGLASSGSQGGGNVHGSSRSMRLL